MGMGMHCHVGIDHASLRHATGKRIAPSCADHVVMVDAADHQMGQVATTHVKALYGSGSDRIIARKKASVLAQFARPSSDGSAPP